MTQLVAADGCSGPDEACHNDDEDQDKKKETEEVQEETPAKVITLKLVFEELQRLKEMISGAIGGKARKNLDTVDAEALRPERERERERMARRRRSQKTTQQKRRLQRKQRHRECCSRAIYSDDLQSERSDSPGWRDAMSSCIGRLCEEAWRTSLASKSS